MSRRRRYEAALVAATVARARARIGFRRITTRFAVGAASAPELAPRTRITRERTTLAMPPLPARVSILPPGEPAAVSLVDEATVAPAQPTVAPTEMSMEAPPEMPTEVLAAVPTVASPDAPTDAPTDVPTEVLSPVRTQRPRRRGARAVAIAAITVAVLAGAYVGAQLWAGQRVADGVSVLGVDLSGMSRTQARAAISEAAAQRDNADIQLVAGDVVYAVSPSEAGVSVDVDATTDAVVGFTLDPGRLVTRIRGGEDTPARVRVDRGMFVPAIEAAAAELNRDQTEVDVRVDGGRVVVAGGDAHIVVDTDATADAVLEAWPQSASIAIVGVVEQPAITRAQADEFAAQVNTRELAGPITLTDELGDTQLAAEEWAPFARVSAVGNVLTLEVDGEALTAYLQEEYPQLEGDARPAGVSFDDAHQIVIDRGQPGRVIDAAHVSDRVLEAARSTSRTAGMPFIITEQQPVVPGLNIDDFAQRISAFDTPLTYERIRTLNLVHAAEKVSGTILLPGADFDLTEVLSPITKEDGYHVAGVINNGIHTEAMGGGLSQMATTSYNAAYLAGFDIKQHRQHSVWFTRYPAGRESTIYEGQINMVFTNDTPYAAVMNAYVEDNRLHVDIWSTPYYTVSTWASPRTNVRPAGTRVVSGSQCVPSSAGQSGFTITNYRQVFLDDELVKDEQDTWTYRPDDAITCE